MTLVLAWKSSRSISIISDSRLSNDHGIVTDQATKIFRIQVNLKTPYGAGYKKFPPKNYCLCFTGSYLNGSLLVNTIEALFNDITFFNKDSEYTFDHLSKIAFSIYKHISKQLSAIHREKGLSEVLFGGECYKTHVVKFSKFKRIKTENNKLVFENQSVNLDENPTSLGNSEAIKKFKELYQENKSSSENTKILKRIIDDIEIKTVGGEIQMGHFKDGNFEYCTIMEYFQKKDNHEFQSIPKTYLFSKKVPIELDAKIKFRGIDLAELMKEFQPERVNFGLYQDDPLGTMFNIKSKNK